MKKWTVINYYIISVAITTVVGNAEVPEAPLRVVGFDLTKTGSAGNCPSPWYMITVNGRKMCRVPSDTSGCSSVTYPLYETEYNKIRGRIRGYQKGNTDGFAPSDKAAGISIDGVYVDGVSITIGYPRQHVWTYAAGVSADGNHPKSNCPCAATRGSNPPSFVGNNYYCQSGSQWIPDHETYFTDNPLWQGNCTYSKNNCCANVGLPWFARRLPSIQYDDIEVRICYDETYSSEAVLIDQLEIEVYAV